MKCESSTVCRSSSRLLSLLCARGAWRALLPMLCAACLADGRFEEVSKSICKSTEIWTYSDQDSPLMNPGRSCVKCHAETDDPAHAPLYTVAGTVMSDVHEADDCRGVAGMTVILTDADGEDWTMTANSAGNFWLDPEASIAMPYTARIVDSAGRERIKQVPVSEGDCASCHSEEGKNGAPGRLLPPDDD
jgi:hypothetical protein